MLGIFTLVDFLLLHLGLWLRSWLSSERLADTLASPSNNLDACSGSGSDLLSLSPRDVHANETSNHAADDDDRGTDGGVFPGDGHSTDVDELLVEPLGPCDRVSFPVDLVSILVIVDTGGVVVSSISVEDGDGIEVSLSFDDVGNPVESSLKLG